VTIDPQLAQSCGATAIAMASVCDRAACSSIMRTGGLVASIAIVLGSCSLAAIARAGQFTAELPPQGIYGGEPSGECEWPSAVFLGGCTGTLVHPEVVIYAAHCGADVSWAWFGEDNNSEQGRYVDTEFCRVIPGGTPGAGTDFAVCKLAEPVTDVPIVPPLMGCEADILQPGLDVWLVGFGQTEFGGFGTKYEVAVQVDHLQNDEVFLGGNGLAPCYGDSGGPAYVRLPAELDPEQSWRVFGITSWGGECGGGGYYSMMHMGMDWFEQETGIDVTPCHDADGTWNPGPDCGGFPLDPSTGHGSWPACGAGTLSGAAATCGPANGDAGDDGSATTDDGGGDEDPPPHDPDTGDDGEGGSVDAGDDADPPSTDDGDDDGDAGDDATSDPLDGEDDDDDDGDDGAAGPPVLPPGFGLQQGEAGCGCRASTSRAAWGPVLLGLLALVRRPRGRRRWPR
jgi:hypothetical protein